MLKIRLTRRGKKNKVFFRIVVAEHTSPIKGGFLEVLGFLNPHTKEKDFKTERIKHWLEKGAQCSDSAHNLLVSNGIVKGPKRAIKIKQKPTEEAKIDEAGTKEKAEESKPEEKKEETKAEEKAEPASAEVAAAKEKKE